MACMTVFAPKLAMATMQLTRVVRCEPVAPSQLEQGAQHTSLRMNWIVTTDNNGNRSLRMLWRGTEI